MTKIPNPIRDMTLLTSLRRTVVTALDRNSASGSPRSEATADNFGGNRRAAIPPSPSSLQPLIQPRIRHLPHLRREVVLAVRVVRRQLLLRPEQLVHRVR